MSDYRGQVRAVLDAVTIRPGSRFTWRGRLGPTLPVALAEQLGPAERRDFLHETLTEELYWSFYCRGRVGPSRRNEPEPVSSDPRLMAAMAAANTGRGALEEGWRVERLERDAAVVSSDRLGVRMRVPADGQIAGAAVAVARPSTLPALSPGFLTLLGDAGTEVAEGVVRVYWHVVAAGAPRLVGTLTSRLNRAQTPFRLKVLDHPLRFERCDAAVLYLRAGDFAAVRPLLAHAAGELADVLRPAIPAFTLTLAPGVGLAEDDGAGESFGMRRCELLADAVIDGCTSVERVAERFAGAGVDLDAPYRDPALAGRHAL